VVKGLQEQFEAYADNFPIGLNTQQQLLNLQFGMY
jgi:predicted oxidoreductase (fatty acid repression mutant protein)